MLLESSPTQTEMAYELLYQFYMRGIQEFWMQMSCFSVFRTSVFAAKGMAIQKEFVRRINAVEEKLDG